MPRRLPALPVTRLRQGTRRMGPDGAVLQLHPRAEHPRPGQVHGLLGQASFKLGDFAAQYRRSRRRPPADRQAAAPSQNQPKRSSYPPRVQLRSVNLAGNIFLPSLARVIRRFTHDDPPLTGDGTADYALRLIRPTPPSPQNATRRPPLAVAVRLWSDIAMPSIAPNTATFLLV